MERDINSPEAIEQALARLVPASLSEEGLSSMEEVIDELANEPASAPVSRPRRFWWIGGIAALWAALMALMIPSGSQVPETPALARIEPAELILLEESDRVVAAEQDEMLLTENDGSVHRAWHVQVINEERFRDVETGFEVMVTHPRDELVLMPVSHF